jgi:hypothetical protein
MATSSSRAEEQQITELDERQKLAWSSYSESLKGLTGEAYEEAETKSWNRLQVKLKDLDVRRKRAHVKSSTGTSRR